MLNIYNSFSKFFQSEKLCIDIKGFVTDSNDLIQIKFVNWLAESIFVYLIKLIVHNLFVIKSGFYF